MPKIEMCEDMTGKMEGMISVSTSVLSNPNCCKNHKIKGSICEHCYSHNMAKMYAALDAKNQRNTEILTSGIIPWDELPVIDSGKYPICRLEAFGDLHNAIQLENYMNLVKKNPDSKWTLYTKMYRLTLDYFATHDVPANFTLMISSLFVNKRISLDPWKRLHKFGSGQLKVFTVWDKDYIKAHTDELDLNCGARSCFRCRRCYNQCETEEINEILKSDQGNIGVYMAVNDPKKRQEVASNLTELLDDEIVL